MTKTSFIQPPEKPHSRYHHPVSLPLSKKIYSAFKSIPTPPLSSPHTYYPFKYPPPPPVCLSNSLSVDSHTHTHTHTRARKLKFAPNKVSHLSLSLVVSRLFYPRERITQTREREIRARRLSRQHNLHPRGPLLWPVSSAGGEGGTIQVSGSSSHIFCKRGEPSIYWLGLILVVVAAAASSFFERNPSTTQCV